MPWGAVAAAAIGGYASMSAADKQAEAAEKVGKADPRFNALIYGDDKNNLGLLRQMQDWYEKNQTGLNDQMRQGLNDQWATLNDPNLRNGYNNMSNLGDSLMSAPVAGNPFADGRASLDKPFQPMQGVAQPQRPSMGLFEPSRTEGPQRNQPQLLSAQPASPARENWAPVAFGVPPAGVGAGVGGAPVPGPFSAPAAPVAAVAAPVMAAPAAAPVNRPFDLAAYTDEFWKKQLNGTATQADIHEYNTITNANAG